MPYAFEYSVLPSRQSWTAAPGLPLHVMRYEDLLADAGKAYRALFGRAPRDDRRNFRAGEGRTGWFMTPPGGQELQ